ncbi:MAG TPA: hypothetical protein VII06_11235 [Chloroflexota bacterium]
MQLEPGTDVVRIIEDVHDDKTPRLIERDGQPLAVVVDPDDFATWVTVPKSKRHKAELLALAGAWKELDADRLIDHIYRARRESPPSDLVEP